MEYTYWPYDEVTIEVGTKSDNVLIKSPWVEAKMPVTETNKNTLENLIPKFKNTSLNGEDLPYLNQIFSKLSDFPFCYILPTKKENKILNNHSIINSGEEKSSMAELLGLISQRLDPKKEDISAFSDLETKLPRKEWLWDADAALSFAKFADKVHPESLFSVTRRYHFLELLESDTGIEGFNFIESLQDEEYAKGASLLVRQNHYVTQKCQKSLLPAVSVAQDAKGLVEEFIAEEKGHDRILNIALKDLSENPESIPASSHTIVLMYLLEYSAQTNFLAFAMIVNFFERSSYQETDPLAQLLIKGGFTKAAKQINHHMEINDAGGHENLALGFLEYMNLCDSDYALEAIHLAELTSMVMSGVTKSAVDLYKK